MGTLHLQLANLKHLSFQALDKKSKTSIEMKIFCTMLLALAVAISMKRCKAKFLLVEADKAPEKAQDELENLPSELFPIIFNKIKRLEEKLEEKDVEMKERDEEMNLLASQVKNHSARLENLQGFSTIEIVFIVTATKTNGYIPTGIIKFDDKIIDNSNSFDIKEGKFIVPSSGNYLFFFDSTTSNTGYSDVTAYVNGNYGHHFRESNGDMDHPSHQHIFMFASRLEKDDVLWLENHDEKTLRNYEANPMTFVGYKQTELFP